MALTREQVEARLAQLRADFDLKRLETAAIDGAIQDCEWVLAQIGSAAEGPGQPGPLEERDTA